MGVGSGVLCWRSSCCFVWSCDRPAKVQKRMKAYERTAPQATATSFETLPHSVGLVIKGCNTFPASHTRPLLYRISSARMMLKRTTSRLVVRRLCPNVQYLFKKKLLTACRSHVAVLPLRLLNSCADGAPPTRF